MHISITPYKELLYGGEESIYDHICEGYSVSDSVITYLKSGQLTLASPGVYPHPFEKGVNLHGPYVYTDGTYCWDRDTWIYVTEYGLMLPQEFVDHVMRNYQNPKTEHNQ